MAVRPVTLFIGVLLLACWPSEAGAHARGTSFSYWERNDETISGTIVFPWAEVQQAFRRWRTEHPESFLADEAKSAAILDFFRANVRLEAKPACTDVQWTGPTLRDTALLFKLTAHCSEGAQAIRFDLTFDVAPSHVHLARYEDAGLMLKGAITSASREFPLTFEEAAALPSGFASFVTSGFEHILAGLDHLLFLLALLLLAPSLGALAGLVTGFTLAHSASLAVAVYGLSRPDGPTVEALIGFTVAFSGLEVFLALGNESRSGGGAEDDRWIKRGFAFVALGAALAAVLGWLNVGVAAVLGAALFSACFLWLDDGRLRWRWLLVFFFGFVHGFGFAGPLVDMDLTRAETAQALLGFNVGVEFGQLAFLLVLWPFVAAVRRTRYRVPVTAALAAVVIAAGIQWFLLRAI